MKMQIDSFEMPLPSYPNRITRHIVPPSPLRNQYLTRFNPNASLARANRE